MIFTWDKDKNKKLILERGISFDEIEEAIRTGGLIAIQNHKNITNYAHQKILMVELNGYIHKVPSIVLQEKPKVIYMVTAFKDRKANQLYKKGEL